MGLDGEKNLYYTFLKATEFIQSAVEEVIYILSNTYLTIR